MRGFTDRALILGPDPGACDGKPDTWKRRLKESIQNIINYCEYNYIDVYYLITDEMLYKSPAIVGRDVHAINTLGRGDMHFLSQHNNVYSSYSTRETTTDYSDIVKKAMDSIPLDPDNKTDDARITVVSKREAKVAREIIKQFNLIFNIQFKTPKQYKAVTKQGDCRAVVDVDAKTFLCSVAMSGQVLAPIDVLDLRCATLPVHDWEVPTF